MAVITESGDFLADVLQFEQDLNDDFPEGDDNFVIPTRAELEGLPQLVAYMEAGDTASADSHIAAQGYQWEVVEYTDTVSNDLYYLIREPKSFAPVSHSGTEGAGGTRESGKKWGWGWHVWHSNPKREVAVHVHHPVNDTNTPEIGAKLFRDLDCVFLQVSGCHRDNIPGTPTATWPDPFLDKSDPPDMDFHPVTVIGFCQAREHLTVFAPHAYLATTPGREDWPHYALSEGWHGAGVNVRSFTQALNDLAPYYRGNYGFTPRAEIFLTGQETWDLISAQTDRIGNHVNAFNGKLGTWLHIEMSSFLRFSEDSKDATIDMLFRAATDTFPDVQGSIPNPDGRVISVSNRGDPTEWFLHFTQPLSSAGTTGDYDFSARFGSLDAVELLHGGYTVKLTISGMARQEIETIDVATGALTTVFGSNVAPKDAPLEIEPYGAGGHITHLEDIPVDYTHREDTEVFPAPETWTGHKQSGLNLFHTFQFHPEVSPPLRGTAMLCRNRDPDFFACYREWEYPQSTEVWMRARVFLQVPWEQEGARIYVLRMDDPASGASVILLSRLNSTENQLYWQIRMEDDAGNTRASLFDNTVPERRVLLGRWQEIEAHWTRDFDPPDGQVEMFLNGTKVVDMTYDFGNTSGFTRLRAGMSFQSRDADLNDLYLDQVTVSPTRYGGIVPKIYPGDRKLTQNNNKIYVGRGGANPGQLYQGGLYYPG